MNIYDQKTVRCVSCDVCIGEIDFDAEVVFPKCGRCANPLPEGDKILYTVSHFQNNPLKSAQRIQPLKQIIK